MYHKLLYRVRHKIPVERYISLVYMEVQLLVLNFEDREHFYVLLNTTAMYM